MRKFLLLLAAVLLMSAGSVSKSFAQAAAPVHHHHHHNYWWLCGIGSAVSLIVGSEIKMNDADEARRRQLTITEATWFASVCPIFLPVALISTATCPDNKATVEVARLAYLYLRKKPGSDQGAFTLAYAEACQTGKLSRATRGGLLKLIG
jgi:hypothetical protein